MSTINTNGIDVNYPVPGVNNNSQGFRDNFASIKTNINTAATEITDLQNKVVVKQALTGSTLNNDMANTLISNASTRSFRATTNNLGNALSGTVLVNVSLGDVHYGTIAGDTVLQFGSWAPTGTQSNVQLNLSISNANATITFPTELYENPNGGITTLENYAGNGNITIPYGVSELDYRISTLDCGVTLTIEPYNRPRISTQIQELNVTPTGFQGDVAGDIAVSGTLEQLTISATNSADYFTTTDTTGLYTDLPITFTGNTAFEPGITAGSTYYVRNVVSSTTFTVSSTIGGSNVNLTGGSGTMYANPITYLYVCTNDYNSTTYEKTVSATNSSGNITLSNTTSLANNAPIIFAGTGVGGIQTDIVYYIKTIGSGGNITISRSRTNGVADSAVTLTTATATDPLTGTAFVGSDIWKRIPLTSF